MKILAVSDTHADTSLLKKIGKMANKEKVDLIAIAGDLTLFGQKAKTLIKPLENKYRDILLIHGNHEDESLIEFLSSKYKNTFNLHKNHHIKNNIGFFGSGTTDWGFRENQNQILSELSKAHKKISHLDKKIMLTHSPPSNSSTKKFGIEGSKAVTKAIHKFKPDFLICGHVHEVGGIIDKIGKTTVIHAAKSPSIIKI